MLPPKIYIFFSEKEKLDFTSLFHQVQFHEMGEPMMKKPRRPRQARPHDEELERQIRMLLVSNFDEAECKTTWSCAQCNYSNKLQYTVKKQD